MAASQQDIPVLTVDGPSGTGKGTISRMLAQWLGFHFLDSGALYRLTALAANNRSIELQDAKAVAAVAAALDVRFDTAPDADEIRIYLDNQEVTDELRTEACGGHASVVAAIPEVRDALLERQRQFRQAPGLVADGRDMGTVVFPQAVVKVYLTASREERARRRHNQLRQKGIGVTLERLLKELAERDSRDSQRKVAPLKPADDAVIIDTTSMSIEEVFEQCKRVWRERQGGPVD